MNPTPSLRERQKVKRQSAIETAAFDLFLRDGIAATSLEHIAARADVSKGTVLNYFASKHHIVAARLQRLAVAFLGLTEKDHAPGDPLARFGRFFRDAEALLKAEGPGLIKLYSEALVRPDLILIDQQTEVSIVGWYVRVLSEGQTKGTLKTDFSPDIAASVIIDVWSATMRVWMTSGATFSLASRLQKKLALLFAGLAEPASRSLR